MLKNLLFIAGAALLLSLVVGPAAQSQQFPINPMGCLYANPVPATPPAGGYIAVQCTAAGALSTNAVAQPSGSILLTSANPPGCSTVLVGKHVLFSITSAYPLVQSQTLYLYDEGQGGTCNSVDQIFAQALPASAIIQWNTGFLLNNGLTYRLTGYLTVGANIKIMGI